MSENEPWLLNNKTIERYAREWEKRSGKPFVMRAKKIHSGLSGHDVIEIHEGEGSSNSMVEEYLLQSGEIILDNEMDLDKKEP